MLRLRSASGIQIVALLLAMYGSAAAESTVALDAASLVAAIRENADRLRSGEFVATGTLVWRHFDRDKRGRLTSKEPTEVNNYRELIECVFDFDNGRFSFRRRRERTNGAEKQPNLVYHYVGLPNQAVFLRSNIDGKVEVNIQDPLFPENDGKRFIQPVFDPRVMGFAGLLKLHGRFEELFIHYFPDEQTVLYNEGAGLWRLDNHLSFDNEQGLNFARSWWCDETQGLQPVKYQVRSHQDETALGAEYYNKRARPSQESEVTWSNTSGIWVPKTLNLFGVMHNYDARLQLEVDWRNVNQRISETAFDWRQWDLPKNTVVYDDRLHGDTPLMLAVSGQSLEVELTGLERKRNLSPLLVLNTIVFGGVIGHLVKRKFFNRFR